ncbi:ABC-2 type transport system ATP-binding protein [Mycobacterium sp. MAA66]|uniref:ATP-binding cassette domain-containing protein n=1 Tax=Mycobacterium sp. MAA66 TaxID=3156297 RepID=UPI003514D374
MIQLTSLTKVYRRNRAVDGLTCSVEPGHVTGFLGPNGAGKSTTMRMIVGLDRPTAGTATVLGKRYCDLKYPLRHVGALLDARQVHPSRSARAHLRWLAATNALPGARVDEVLGIVGLSEVADRQAGSFSLGMAQRLGIAVALLGDPEVLLFDEPVNGLDPEGIRWIRTLMRELAAEGRTVLVSSHLLAEMSNTADRLLVIGRGRLIASTTMADFLADSGVGTVRVRSPQLDLLHELLTAQGVSVRNDDGALLAQGVSTEQVGQLAADRGLTLHELSTQRASLEEAYLRMTDDAVDYRAAGA